MINESRRVSVQVSSQRGRQHACSDSEDLSILLREIQTIPFANEPIHHPELSHFSYAFFSP